ncbi:FKBP-type peptidyl-prolyl cis-trans isomerase [uncultured Microbacterium sp.]|uniref:FKBP-type peptidyl-prolyl cis-trans isomerase n=1 Tax=uncultured Microbacterium sp. TaxID=191216 RepID=UPI0035C94DF8
MRKIPAVVAALGLAALALAGCSASGSASGSASCPRPSVSASPTLDGVTVAGDTDAAPVVTLPTPFHLDATASEDVVAGDGTAITDSEQLVVLDISLSSGATGKKLIATPYDGDLSRVFPLSRWVETFPGFADALHCATVGSRVVVGLAPGDIQEQTMASLGLKDGDSAIAVVDVRKAFLTKADGANQYNDALGMPTVVRAPDGRPGIIVPDATPPSDLVVQTIKKGDGPEVTGDVPVRIAYTGVTWENRKVFDTTWGSEPPSTTLTTLVPGLAEGLKGQTVGSQVLVVVPPDQGYGATQKGSVPANSTLVYVVDILGLDQAPAN